MPKHVKVDEPERLTKYLATHSHSHEPFKALVLKLVDELEDVERVSQITTVPAATIYQWLAAWNKKKSPDSPPAKE
jgi:anaerobic selenocysteine-containing dehydrogenase